MSRPSKLKKFKVTRPVICLSDSELQKFLDAARSPAELLRFLLMADAGLRIGEVLKLKWPVLWFAGVPVGAIEVSASVAKNDRPRTIPVTERLSDAIESVIRPMISGLSQLPDKFVVYNHKTARPYTARQIQRDVLKIGWLSLSKQVTPHVLRHTFATRLMRKCPIRVVQQLLGHSSLQSTQIYTHPNNQDCQKAIDALNEKAVT